MSDMDTLLIDVHPVRRAECWLVSGVGGGRVFAPDNGVTAVQLLIIEYKVCIGTWGNLSHDTLAVIAVALHLRQMAHVLILFSPMTASLGWACLVNDLKISVVGRCIRKQLASLHVKIVGEVTSTFARYADRWP